MSIVRKLKLYMFALGRWWDFRYILDQSPVSLEAPGGRWWSWGWTGYLQLPRRTDAEKQEERTQAGSQPVHHWLCHLRGTSSRLHSSHHGHKSWQYAFAKKVTESFSLITWIAIFTLQGTQRKPGRKEIQGFVTIQTVVTSGFTPSISNALFRLL